MAGSRDRERVSWGDSFRALGSAFVDMAKAEAGVMGEEWKSSGHLLVKGAALLAAAGSLLFCVPALTSFALVAWLGPIVGSLWKAALVVAGLYALIAMLLAFGAYLFWRRLESPTRSAKRRLGEHLDWWQEKIFKQERALGGGEQDGTA